MNIYSTLDSPIDPLMLVTDGEFLTGLHMDAENYREPGSDQWKRDQANPLLKRAAVELREYFHEGRKEFTVPLGAKGTEFQRQVWSWLRRIPYGETWSYGELAKRAGDPKASRAVGAANGRNPLAVIVPCHRVIGTNGKLVGFGGGLPRKAKLLALERAISFGENPEAFWSGYL